MDGGRELAVHTQANHVLNGMQLRVCHLVLPWKVHHTPADRLVVILLFCCQV